MALRRPGGLSVRGRFRTVGLDETLGAMRSPKLEQTLERALLKSGAVVQTEITTNQIIRSSLGPVDPHRVTSRSGELRRSLSGRRGIDDSRARRRRRAFIDVGSDLVYAAVHELGSIARNIPARPFITPGFEESERTIEAIFLNEWRSAVFEA